MDRPRPADLKNAILDAARRAVATAGVASLSMRGVAGAVGCTATSIYLYYRDKEDLLHALADEGVERLIAEMGAASAAPSAHPRLAAACQAYVRFAEENPSLYELMFMRPHAPPAAAQPPCACGPRWLAFLGELAGGAPQARAEAAGVLWAELHGAVSLALLGRLPAGLDRGRFLQAAALRAARTARCESTRPSNFAVEST
jgi:AcrR family transcriptional regulator